MYVGSSPQRLDALDKVTGRARYTDDCCPVHALVAKVLHATIANGKVLDLDLTEALAVPGVVKIVTCFDSPDYTFDTGTHPWIPDPPYRAIEDRRILNTRIRYYGDDIAAVVARDELSAQEALRRIKVTYEEYPPVLDVFSAMEPGAVPVHDQFPDNILAHSQIIEGDYEAAIGEPGLIRTEGWYETPAVKHCQLEPSTSFAYMEQGRLTVYSSTQTPHSLRRVIGQALGIPWGQIRVRKPWVGGGFGAKEDAHYEPLNAFLCQQVGGQCVKLTLTREEDFVNTRTRHGMHFHLITHTRPDGTIVARRMEAWANKGCYGHHGHAIACKAASAWKMLYPTAALYADLYTVFTNTPCTGAMRGYGAPQGVFATEAHMEDIAKQLGMDSLDLRRKNYMPVGYSDPGAALTNHVDSLGQCMDRALELTNYRTKMAEYAQQTGTVRRGIGFSTFWYNTGAYPHLQESSVCRMMLNQDGSVMLHTPEVEIGQGSDTVFTQMAADVLDLPLSQIHLVSHQDTDHVGYGSGAYASRQTYVGGAAIYETGLILKKKILDHAARMLGCGADTLDICQGNILDENGTTVLTVADVAMDTAYGMESSEHLIAEKTTQITTNALSLGCCVAEVEVDLTTGQIRPCSILNVHDCGRVINPALAEAQVHGGISMGIGYALSEELLLNPVTGQMYNDNLLDYKLPTALDHPALSVDFVENPEPTHPFGVKGLGEPPVVPVAPAIRNAVLNATGVAFDRLPLEPQRCLAAFRALRKERSDVSL